MISYWLNRSGLCLLLLGDRLNHSGLCLLVSGDWSKGRLHKIKATSLAKELSDSSPPVA